MRTVETRAEMLMSDSIGSDPEKGDIGVAIGTSTLETSSCPANEELAGVHPVTSGPGSTASPVLPSYPVGREITLPFGQLLPRCGMCDCSALIQVVFLRKHKFFLCLDHGLRETSDTRDLALGSGKGARYAFISPEHEAAIRAFFA